MKPAIFIKLFLTIVIAAGIQVQHAHSQTIALLSHANLTGTGFSTNTYTASTINNSAQAKRVDKRYLKFQLYMGNDYNLGKSTATYDWTVSLSFSVTVNVSGVAQKTYAVTLATNNLTPEKTVVIDYTPYYTINTNTTTFTFSGYSYTNAQTFAQTDVKLKIEEDNTIAYDTKNAANEILPSLVSVVPATNASTEQGAEITNVTFNWSVGANQGFADYDLEVLKVEPSVYYTTTGTDAVKNGVYVDWSKAATIEVAASAATNTASYNMTLSEGTGYYFWRVRPVGTYYTGGRKNIRNLGKWTNIQAGATIEGKVQENSTAFGISAVLYTFTGGVPAAVVPTGYNTLSGATPQTVTYSNQNNCFFYYKQFNDDINWSYGKVLSEGSRQSETMTFANGLNQVTQAQTKLFSDGGTGQVIGQQNILDYNGRPSLKTLPAPINSNKLGYRKNFFLNSSSTNFNAANFDGTVNSNSTTTIFAPQVLTSGAATGTPYKYYSDNNTLGHKAAFTPDAENFPFIRTLYYSDATGRVRTQGGAGAVMQLSSSGTKNTVFLQGGTSQDELDRVFGNEAPLFRHTYKEVTVDPNGVTTVTYKGKKGEVLATCLNSPASLPNLDNVGNESIPTAGFSTSHVFDPGVVVSGNTYSESSKTILCEASTNTLELNYSITPKNVSLPCTSICRSCDYIVEIAVINPQDPTNVNSNIKLEIIVPGTTVSAGLCGDLIPLDLTYFSGTPSGFSIRWTKADGTTSSSFPAGVSSGLNFLANNPHTVTLSGPETYLIKKRVYAYTNNTSNPSQTYLQDAEDLLKANAATWTASSNCCGPIATSQWEDNCSTTISGCFTDGQVDANYLQMLYDFVKDEQTSGASYLSALSTAPLSSGNSFYSGATPTANFETFVEHLLGTTHNIPCDKLYSCFASAGSMLNMNQGNFSANTNGAMQGNLNPSPSSNFDNTFDLLKFVMTCLDVTYDPGDPTHPDVSVDLCKKRKYVVCSWLSQADNESSMNPFWSTGMTIPDVSVWDPSEFIVVGYNTSSCNYGSPSYSWTPVGSGAYSSPSYTASLNVQVFPSSAVSASTDPSCLSSAISSEVAWGNNCFNAFRLPNPNAPSDPAEAMEWAAKNICDCIKNSAHPVTTPPAQTTVYDNTYSGHLAMVQTCKDNCDERTLAFDQSIDAYVNAFNLDPVHVYNSPNLNDPSTDGMGSGIDSWYSFADLFPGEDKSCFVSSMVNRCYEQCNMPYTTAVLYQVENNAVAQNFASGATAYPVTYVPVGSATTTTVTLNSLGHLSSATIAQEQQYFQQALTLVPAFSPQAAYSYPTSPTGTGTVAVNNFLQALPYADAQTQIVDFAYTSLQNAFSMKTATSGTLLFDNLFNAACTTGVSSGDVKTHQEYKDFLMDLPSGGGTRHIYAVTNVVWEDKIDIDGANPAVTGRMLEMNVAFYCYTASPNSSLVPFAEWHFNPAATCLYFEPFKTYYGYSVPAFVKFNFDYAGVFHGALTDVLSGDCLPSVSTLSSTGGIATVPYEGFFDLTINSGGASGNSITPEVLTSQNYTYLTAGPVFWNTSPQLTKDDIITAINNFNSNPEFTAVALTSTKMRVYMNTSSTYPFASNTVAFINYNLNPAGSVPYTFDNGTGGSPANGNMELTGTPFNTAIINASCGTETPPTGACPYGYFPLNGTLPTFATTTDLFNNFLQPFYTNSIMQGVLNRTTVTGQSPQYPITNFPATDFHYYQQVSPFIYNNIRFNAVATVLRSQTTGKMILAEMSIYGCSTSTKIMNAYLFNSKQNNKDCTLPIVYMDSLFPELDIPNPLPVGSTFLNNYFTLSFPSGKFTVGAVDFCSGAQDYHCFNYVEGTNVVITPTVTKFIDQLNVYFDSQVTGLDADYTGGGTLATALNVESGCPTSANACTLCMAWEKVNTNPNTQPNGNLDPLTCEEASEIFVNTQVANALHDCLEDKLATLRSTYKTNCLDNINDAFTVKQTLYYHHYTLYYYDRAGNLIQTVPPEGVKYVTLPSTGLNNYRSNTTLYAGSIQIPGHKLKSKYETNSIKQVIVQSTPDGNPSSMWYNQLGQLVLSQDGEQADRNAYSYTRFDELGRVVESGELIWNPANISYSDSPDNQQVVNLWNNMYFPYTNQACTTLVAGISGQMEVVKTEYTTPDYNMWYNGATQQQNLRNRISKVSKYDDLSVSTPDYVTWYSYDPHGNVEWLVQYVKGLGKKQLRYEYDLISGNVNKVFYMEGGVEQFIHRYEYDSDNRITKVYTSKDGVMWDNDATYSYYSHGPVGREEIGEDGIQGTDYVYTIEGYLKAINQPELLVNKDPGTDGYTTTSSRVAKDEFGMELGYYQNDYTRASTNLGASAVYDPYGAASSINTSVYPLYNGNISFWATNTRSGGTSTTFAGYKSDIKLFKYRYDKLNRLKGADFRRYDGQFDPYWNDASGVYDETFTYDASGNINTLTRNGNQVANLQMDNLTYYYSDQSGKMVTGSSQKVQNRLWHVSETVSGATYTDDIDDNGLAVSPGVTNVASGNYAYDNEGKLIKDTKENILEIKWTALNKPKSIKKFNPSTSMYYYILFGYDAMGNRVWKATTQEVASNPSTPAGITRAATTYYALDAKGTTMAIYSKVYTVTGEGNFNTYTLDELPIYGSSRIGEYKPALQLAQYSGTYNGDDAELNAPSNSEFLKLYLPTNNGVKSLDYTLSNTVTVGSSSQTTTCNNTAFIPNTLNNAAVGAYFDDGTPKAWKLRKTGFTLTYTTTTQIPNNTGSNSSTANPVIVKKPGTANWFFVYPTTLTGFSTINYVDVSTTTVTTATDITSTGTALTFGQKQVALNYGSGTSKIFMYKNNGTSGTGTGYQIYCSDVTYNSSGVGVINYPVLAATVTTSTATIALSENLDMAISPKGDKLAMVVHRTASLGNSRIVVFNLNPLTGVLTSPVYYDNNTTYTVKGIEFSHSGRFLLYSRSDFYIGRIDLQAGTFNNTFYNMGGSTEIDILRTMNNRMMLAQSGSGNLQYIVNADDPSATSGVLGTATALGGTTTVKLGLPNQPVYIADNMRLNTSGTEVVGPGNTYARVLDQKYYEIKDHLGNVRVVVKDLKLWNDGGTANVWDNISESAPKVESFTDYYAFGSPMPGRSLTPTSYRYGYNGKEKDDEIKGIGNSYDYGERMFDSRLARFLSLDRYMGKYPQLSPYGYGANNPIANIDIAGDSIYYVNARGQTFNMGTYQWAAVANEGWKVGEKFGYQIALAVPETGEVIEKYAKSSTHDIYIMEGTMPASATNTGMATYKDVGAYMVKDGKISVTGNANVNDEWENAYKNADGVKVKNKNSKVSLIAINPEYLNKTGNFASFNVLDMAESIWHEIYIHIENATGDGTQDHKNAGTNGLDVGTVSGTYTTDQVVPNGKVEKAIKALQHWYNTSTTSPAAAPPAVPAQPTSVPTYPGAKM